MGPIWGKIIQNIELHLSLFVARSLLRSVLVFFLCRFLFIRYVLVSLYFMTWGGFFGSIRDKTVINIEVRFSLFVARSHFRSAVVFLPHVLEGCIFCLSFSNKR